MYYPMTHYYFFKDLTEKLNSLVLNNIEITDDLTFNAANFNNTAYFYKLISFGKDKYSVVDQYDEKFNEFIVDCAINISKNNDFNALYFLYGMISSHILDKYIKVLTDAFKKEKMTYLKASNMADYYMAKLNNVDLCHTTIYKEFPKAFNYPDYLDELVHSACIKNFKLMASDNYFRKAYKRKKAFYKNYTRTTIKTPFIAFLYLLKLKKINYSQFKYRENIDFDIFNTKKLPYTLNGSEVSYSFSELLNVAKADVLKAFKAVDEYVFNEKEKDLREYFNIPKEKIM